MTTAPSHGPGSITADGRIVRVAGPQNEEFDFALLAGTITPTEQFYIRSHGRTPTLDPTEWRLEVTGMVERPLSLTLAALQAMAEQERTLTTECAGNRRTFQDPVPGGVPWQDGAVSTALWAGVPLAAVLQEAGLRPEGRHVLLEGADLCPTDEGPTRFARSIPLDTSLNPESLIALRMNGAPLPPEHGAPARVVMPRLYAMNGIKWLTRLHVQAQPHDGHFQRSDYRLWFSDDDPGREIGAVRVMATIAQPRPGSTHAAGPVRVHGAAWTGTGTVQRVEVSTDGGATWAAARFLTEPLPHVWRLWEHTWIAPPGNATLMARATDSEGNTQPLSLPPNRKGYANNFVLPVPVQIR